MATWQEQWYRVNRMLTRVKTAYSGRPLVGADSDDIRDDLYSFFQSLHHLRDWLVLGGSGLTQADVDAVVNGCAELRICGDLCNGSNT